uniref:Lipoprotein n=1 Tax=Marinomonas sp. (strain MWYL1) TaxID=400668 RepID=A6W3H1_MARMS
MKIKLLLILATLLILTGCEEKTFYVASIGNAGSLDGPYVIGPISVADVLGGGGGFGYGAVNGYPGKSADIGRMGVPKHIEGYWAKQNPNARGYVAFYRISADIDSELAEKKIRTLRNYYQNFKGKTGSMQVLVERERVRVFYTLYCPSHRADCSGKEGADPNGWVIDSPIKGLDVVVLFDGKGEMSLTPFPDSPYED